MATKKKTGRWSGAKQAGDAAAGRSKADSDRKLQQQAASRRKSKPGSSKTSWSSYITGEVLPVLGGKSG